MSSEDVRTRLVALLAPKPGDLDPALGRYGNEVLYLLTEQPDVRATFVRGHLPGGMAEATPFGSARAALASVASRSLRAELAPVARQDARA